MRGDRRAVVPLWVFGLWVLCIESGWLLFRADPRVAIPTAVSLMAFASLVGVAIGMLLATLEPSAPLLHPGVSGHWLAAAPVLVLGAPLGGLAVGLIPRTATLGLVALLCLAQLAWFCAQARLSAVTVALVVGAVLGLGGLFQRMYVHGRAAGRRALGSVAARAGCAACTARATLGLL